MAANKSNRKKKDKTGKFSWDAFLKFWTTLPGILTGMAAVITAVAGLYIAVWKGSPQNNANNPASPTTSSSSSPAAVAASGNCFEQEFSTADRIEEGSSSFLHPKDRVLRIHLTDSDKTLGALRLKIYPGSSDDSTLFKIEEAVDSQCQAVEEFSNQTREGEDKHNLRNYDFLRIRFGDKNYTLRLGYQGGAVKVDQFKRETL